MKLHSFACPRWAKPYLFESALEKNDAAELWSFVHRPPPQPSRSYACKVVRLMKKPLRWLKFGYLD